MHRKITLLVLLLALVFTAAGCSHEDKQEAVEADTTLYLARVNFYKADGTLLDRYLIEYDPTGNPMQITTGIMPEDRVETPLTGAPQLPAGVKLGEAKDTYKSVLLAPCSDGTALLITGAGQEPIWGMVLNGKEEDYTERDGYLTKVTAKDGSYAAFFYFPLIEAASDADDTNATSYEVTEDSDYYGYDKVLTELGTALIAMENDDPVILNEMMFSPLYDSEPDKSSIGYMFVDLDDNGVKELIIGSSGQYGHPVIYDLFAIFNGRIVNVISSTNESTHTLSTNNEILLEATNDEDQPVFAAFSYFNSNLSLQDAVIQGDGVRYHSTKSINDDSTFEEIDYTEAQAIQEKYIEAELEFKPISDYNVATGLVQAPDDAE